MCSRKNVLTAFYFETRCLDGYDVEIFVLVLIRSNNLDYCIINVTSGKGIDEQR